MDRITQQTVLTTLFLALLHCSRVYAQSGDGGGADGYSNSNLGAAGTGAQGSASSSAYLSKGAIIAIAVVVVVVIVGAVVLSVLYFVAKKRQWQVRQSIRRTASRVYTGVKALTPRTPARMSFGGPRSPLPRDGHPVMRKPSQKKPKDKALDLEKGFSSIDQTMQRTSEESQESKADNPSRPLHIKKDSMGGRQKQVKKLQPILTVPPSEFEIDSPKSPLWHKVLGRA